MRETASGSMDLVHAHKVLVYLPFVVTCQYFDEMIRVARRGGSIVFDIVSESCMGDDMIEKWIASGLYFPCMMPREFVVAFFARRQCSLRGSFHAPMMPGQSEYLVFCQGYGVIETGNCRAAQTFVSRRVSKKWSSKGTMKAISIGRNFAGRLVLDGLLATRLFEVFRTSDQAAARH